MNSSYTKHNINDYIGKKFGHLTVIGQSPKTHKYSNRFDFRCDCGNTISEIPSRVLYGHRKSCGVCNHKNSSHEVEEKVGSMVGTRYGMLEIISVAKHKGSNVTYARCKCDCGNIVDVLPFLLFRNERKSCGCAKTNNPMLKNSKSTSSGNFKDGRTKHPLYGIWKQMIDRCENPKTKHYDKYGGRGISVCKEWHEFWKFVEWSDSVGGRPEKYSIDRINNDGDYEPSNCRWADQATQTRNTSRNIILTYNGVSKTLIDWSIETGINQSTLANRIKRGWNTERALTEKTNHNSHKSSRGKILCCYDTNNKLISKYNKLSELPEEFNRPSVTRCCYGGRNTYKGYIWRYEDE